MARPPRALPVLAAACALALGACSKQADTNPTAPGSPGTGNATVKVQPAAPDTGANSAAPGVGLGGGLGSGATAAAGSAPTGNTATSAPMGAGPGVPQGSSNMSPGSAVGTR